MNKLFKNLSIFSIINFLFLPSCSNVDQYPENVREIAYTRSNFDISILNEANKQVYEIFGCEHETGPVYSCEFDKNSNLSKELMILFKDSVIYNDKNYIIGESLLYFCYSFNNNKSISINGTFDVDEKVKPENHPYYDGNNIYYKDFYLCRMLVVEENYENIEHYIIDLQTKENLQKFVDIMSSLIKNYENEVNS